MRIAGMLLFATALGACGARVTDRLPPPETSLTIGFAEAESDSVAIVGTRGLLISLTGAPLVDVDITGRARPALAERWQQAHDGLSWDFFLRPGLTLHDGSPLTARVVAERLASLLTGPADGTRPPGFRDVTSVTAPDPLTVRIQLIQPSALLLEALRLQAIATTGDTEGAGPFVIESVEDGTTRLRAFDGYFEGRPAIDQVAIRVYPAARTAWAAMLRGDVDLLYEIPPGATSFVAAQTDVQIFSTLRPYVYLIGLDLQHPVLGRRDVRLALNLGVRRKDVISAALAGSGRTATGPIWPLHWAYDSDAPAFGFDPAAAERLLDEAGLPRGGGAGGSRFRMRCLVPFDYSPRFERMAQDLRRQLRDIGVDLDLEGVPASELVARLQAGRYDAFLFEMAAGHGLSWPYQWWHSGAARTGLFDPGYRAADAALDLMRQASPEAKLPESVASLQAIFRADPPAVFLAWGVTARAVSRRFVVPSGEDEDIIRTIARWQPAVEAEP